MEPRTVEQVESWSTRSVADGYAGLRELSDGEFSGAVRGGGAWLFMLNGRIVGIFEGTLDDFEDVDGTAYAAPHPSLPLLFSMQEQGGDTRAKYYTNDTPLSEVDDTLSDGKFTGFVELSENVLSGDYYVAYYGGRSLSVAFVGASEQVVTGDEAFERAADEVGIYEVTDVDVEVTDVPEPEDDEPDAASGGGAAGGGSSDDAATGGAAGDASSRDATGSESATGSTGGAASNSAAGAPGSSDSNDTSSTAGSDAAGTGAADRSERSSDPSRSGRSARGASEESPSASRPSGDDAGASGQRRDAGAGGPSDPGTAEPSSAPATDSTDSASTANGPGTADPSPGTEASTSERGRTAEPGRTTDASRETTADRTTSTRDSAGASADASTDRSASGEATVGPDVRDDGPAGDAGARSDAKASDSSTGNAGATENAGPTGSESSAVDGEAEWRDTTTIPSLDPDLSDGPDEPPSDSQVGATAAGGDRSRTSEPGEQSRSGRRPTGERGSESGASGTTGASAGGSNAPESATDSGSGESSEARARVRKLRKQLEQRKQQVEQLKERLSTLESERNEYKRERDALSQEVERLEAKLETSSSADGSTVGRRLSEADAFDGTNLFVRYDSKGEATLDEAAKGQVDRSDVNANLRLEHHTQFEADEASVDGEPFEAFLADSFEYEFASWVVEELLYEIRDTGQRNALKELYEAIPKIDRVDLHGTVSAGDTQEDTRQESFDVIMRDRMGDPLVVADLNDSRNPTTGEMMGSLVDAASGVSQAHDELAGAFQVTASFFEPEALETAEAATSGGLLSREKRASFVKLSRKRGYHLCLVESRGGDFHLNVPEL